MGDGVGVGVGAVTTSLGELLLDYKVWLCFLGGGIGEWFW